MIFIEIVERSRINFTSKNNNFQINNYVENSQLLNNLNNLEYFNISNIKENQENLLSLQTEVSNDIDDKFNHKSTKSNGFMMDNNNVISRNLVEYEKKNWELIFLNTFYERSEKISEYMMGLFYAAIGFSFDISRIKQVQGPLSTLIGITLFSHLSIIIFGSILWNKSIELIKKRKLEQYLCSDTENKLNDKNINRTEDTDNLDDYFINLDTALIAR